MYVEESLKKGYCCRGEKNSTKPTEESGQIVKQDVKSLQRIAENIKITDWMNSKWVYREGKKFQPANRILPESAIYFGQCFFNYP
jgi:hypothetical protein